MIPLTEAILQKCYKTKTYVRTPEWDILWYLGGVNNITIAQKDRHFYLLPYERKGPITETLPFELILVPNPATIQQPLLISTANQLKAVFPEIEQYWPENKAVI